MLSWSMLRPCPKSACSCWTQESGSGVSQGASEWTAARAAAMAKDRSRTEWKCWIPRLENENSKKLTKKRGRANNQGRQEKGRTGRGRRTKRRRDEKRGSRKQRHEKARHYFNVFALKLDVRSCPGLLPGIQHAGIDLEVEIIHE